VIYNALGLTPAGEKPVRARRPLNPELERKP